MELKWKKPELAKEVSVTGYMFILVEDNVEISTQTLTSTVVRYTAKHVKEGRSYILKVAATYENSHGEFSECEYILLMLCN